jgi:hypothetical protein
MAYLRHCCGKEYRLTVENGEYRVDSPGTEPRIYAKEETK